MFKKIIEFLKELFFEEDSENEDIEEEKEEEKEEKEEKKEKKEKKKRKSKTLRRPKIRIKGTGTRRNR